MSVSRRRKKVEDVGELQITSLMDILMILLFYLIVGVVTLKISQIDAPIPFVTDAPPDQQTPEKKKEPFEMLVMLSTTGMVVKSNVIPGKEKAIPNLPSGELDLLTLHTLLLSVKAKYPEEKSIILKPDENVIYQHIVDVMDASRDRLKLDPPTPGLPADNTELFPDVIMEGVI